MIQGSAWEQASMAGACEQVVHGKPSLAELHLGSWWYKAWDKREVVFPVMRTLHLFLNLFCKANNIFKQSLWLLYLQRLGLYLALEQLCSVEKGHSSLTAILEYTFREKLMSKTHSWLCIFCFSLFFCNSSSTGATLKSTWRWCALTSINVQELRVCINSDWNTYAGKAIHNITQQCKFFKKNVGLASFLWTRWKYFFK